MTKKYIPYLFLFFVFLIGCYFRLQGVFTNSFAFTYDVGRDMLNLAQILYQHRFILIGPTTGLSGVFYGPWWYYILLPAFALSGGNPQGVALFMAIIGICTVIGGYYLGKKIEGTLFGIVITILMSISPALIAWSSQIWNPNIAPIIIIGIFSLLYVIHFKKTNTLLLFFLLGMALSLLLDVEIVFGTLFDVGMVISIFLYSRKDLSWMRIVGFLFGYLVILSPRIIFDFRHKFLITKSILKLFKGNEIYGKFNLFNHIHASWSMIFSMWNFTFANQLFVSIILLVFTIFSFVLIRKRISKISLYFLYYCFTIIVIFFIGLTFFKHDIFEHYIVGLPILFILVVTILITTLLQIKKWKVIGYILLAIVLWYAIKPIQFFQNINRPLWIGDASVYRNQVQVVQYVYSQAKGKPFKINVFTPPVFDYSYQYLFQWYGLHEYHYEPIQKTSLAFFILEPDKENPNRLKNWLAIRRGDGKIKKVKKFPSGITVQIRN